MTTRKHEQRAARRARGDDGAALLEFALVSILLFTLIFGIIQFGLILSFDQDVTRAAAEGARGGAVAVPLSSETYDVAAQNAATSATREAVEQMGGRFEGTGCTTAGMQCTVSIIDCPEQPSFRCVQVRVVYDYDSSPLYGNIPLISAFYPDQVQATSIARINS